MFIVAFITFYRYITTYQRENSRWFENLGSSILEVNLNLRYLMLKGVYLSIFHLISETMLSCTPYGKSHFVHLKFILDISIFTHQLPDIPMTDLRFKDVSIPFCLNQCNLTSDCIKHFIYSSHDCQHTDWTGISCQQIIIFWKRGWPWQTSKHLWKIYKKKINMK